MFLNATRNLRVLLRIATPQLSNQIWDHRCVAANHLVSKSSCEQPVFPTPLRFDRTSSYGVQLSAHPCVGCVDRWPPSERLSRAASGAAPKLPREKRSEARHLYELTDRLAGRCTGEASQAGRYTGRQIQRPADAKSGRYILLIYTQARNLSGRRVAPSGR